MRADLVAGGAERLVGMLLDEDFDPDTVHDYAEMFAEAVLRPLVEGGMLYRKGGEVQSYYIPRET